MDPIRRQELIERRALAKAALTRMQTFIESGEHKVHEIEVRSEELPRIFNKYDIVQEELELQDNTDHSDDRQQFEVKYFEVKAKFNELLHPEVDPPWSRHSLHSGVSEHSDHPRRSHASSNIKLPAISLPIFEGNTWYWLQFRDTFEALIVNKATLTNVQKFHYLIASLKNEAKDFISNLQIANKNFAVAWQLVTQRYNNKRVIALMHAKNLCKMPQVKKDVASSLRQLVNHVTSHINALQALVSDVPVKT
jgi:hypothetical protein